MPLLSWFDYSLDKLGPRLRRLPWPVKLVLIVPAFALWIVITFLFEIATLLLLLWIFVSNKE